MLKSLILYSAQHLPALIRQIWMDFLKECGISSLYILERVSALVPGFVAAESTTPCSGLQRIGVKNRDVARLTVEASQEGGEASYCSFSWFGLTCVLCIVLPLHGLRIHVDRHVLQRRACDYLVGDIV